MTGHFTPRRSTHFNCPASRTYSRVAQLHAILMRTVTDGDFAEIAEMLIDKAKKCDLAAKRFLLSYTLGKPSPTVNPDRVAIDEWEIRQEKAVAAPAMEELFAKVSVKKANCMANIAWPSSIYDNFTQQFLSDQQKKTGRSGRAAAVNQRVERPPSSKKQTLTTLAARSLSHIRGTTLALPQSRL